MKERNKKEILKKARKKIVKWNENMNIEEKKKIRRIVCVDTEIM